MSNNNPILKINLKSIESNAAFIVKECQHHGIKVTGVTKSFRADKAISQLMLQAGMEILADSRMDNLKQLRRDFPLAKLMLLRITMPSEAADVVAYCDMSANSEISTIALINEAAAALGRTHGIILMVDMGDLREGLWPTKVVETALLVEGMANVHLVWLAVNFGCFGGVLPDEDNTQRFAELALATEQALGRKLEMVSIGGTTCLELIQSGKLHPAINYFRVGEAVTSGTNASKNSAPIPGTLQNGFRLLAEIVELKEKPSVPQGQIGMDAFGNIPAFPDKGQMLRGVLAIGKQDSSFDALQPLEEKIEILGGSSDHMICDMTGTTGHAVGTTVEFCVGWSAMLHLMTSPYVAKIYTDS